MSLHTSIWLISSILLRVTEFGVNNQCTVAMSYKTCWTLKNWYYKNSIDGCMLIWIWLFIIYYLTAQCGNGENK